MSLIKKLHATGFLQANMDCGKPYARSCCHEYTAGCGCGQVNRFWPQSETYRVLVLPANSCMTLDITSLPDEGGIVDMSEAKEILVCNMTSANLAGCRTITFAEGTNKLHIEKGGRIMLSAPCEGFSATQFTLCNESEFQVSATVTIAGVKK